MPDCSHFKESYCLNCCRIARCKGMREGWNSRPWNLNFQALVALPQSCLHRFFTLFWKCQLTLSHSYMKHLW